MKHIARKSSHRLLTAGICVATLLWTSIPIEARSPILDEERGVLTIAPVIRDAAPAVVNISVTTRVPGADNPLYRDPYFRRFFGLPEFSPEREALSAGSGVIVDAANGYVLTNHHVIENADRITVKLKDGRQIRAKSLGSDAATDIALLKIEAKRLTALPFADTEKLKVGDFVIAIGNPFGLGQTVTSGIVSALGRSGLSRDKFEDFIQTDAPINPGNSGGALINTKGELVGINTAIIAPGGGNVGIGFAVPAKMVKAVMTQLVRHGEVRRGRIGVSIQDVTPDIAQALKLPVRTGALISVVEPGSPAESAGLQAGDTIIEIDGQPVLSSNHVRNDVGLRERGSKVRLTIIRKGKRKDVTLKVAAPSIAKLDGLSTISQLVGTQITEIPSDHPAKGDVEGVLAAEVTTGSQAWRLGLRKGDIILAVNQQPISSLAEFKSATEAASDVLALNILRGNTQLFIVVQ